jgi:hypothetical protein
MEGEAVSVSGYKRKVQFRVHLTLERKSTFDYSAVLHVHPANAAKNSHPDAIDAPMRTVRLHLTTLGAEPDTNLAYI